MDEIWKPVEGFEGYYEVSNTGKVRSMPRTIQLHGAREGQVRTYAGKELKLIHTTDHMMVHLQRGGVRVSKSVGLLVAEHFIPEFRNIERKKVFYRDGNPANTSVDNLVWKSDDEYFKKVKAKPEIVHYYFQE